MRIILYPLFAFACMLLTPSLLFSQQLDYKTLELSIQQAVKKASVATVAVTGYDTVQDKKTGPTFSAVVVSAEGHILTAAHAASANQIYQVVFPDGKKVHAIGLGSIKDVDAAMIKILPAGNWPYAEMAWSSALIPFQPCISMGYPANMRQRGHPLVRFGYVTEESRLNPGFLCNTALMEPGDSGGPLFDINGRVIGIHSRIAQSMDANFEVPVDQFRKYWNHLLVAKNYNYSGALTTQKIESMPAQYAVQPIPALENLHTNLSAFSSTLESTCLKVVSQLNKEESMALGTLISLAKEELKNKSYIISKSSIVGKDSIFVSYKNKPFPAVAIARDSLKDLVLLEVATHFEGGIKIQVASNKDIYSEPGKFLISPGTSYVSVLSAPGNELIVGGLGSYLGVIAEEKNNGLLIKNIDPNSAAKFSNLKVGDKILSIDGVKVNNSEDLEWKISKYKPLTKIKIKGKRNGFGYTKTVILRAQGGEPTGPKHMAELFEGGKSVRRDGFKKAFIHDARLYASECGGPVFDIKGNFMGINIARVCRTSSIAIPAEEVSLFLQTALNK